MQATFEQLRESVMFQAQPGDVEMAVLYGKMRNNAKDDSKRSNESGYHKADIPNIYGVNSSERCYPHIQGIFWEIVFGRHMGWTVNFDVFNRGDKIDFPGVSIKSVSNTSKPHPKLIVKCHDLLKTPKPKWYVLGIVDPLNGSQVECFGMISRKRFDEKKETYPTKENNDPAVFVNEKELRTIDEDVLREAYEEALIDEKAAEELKRQQREEEREACEPYMCMVDAVRRLNQKVR